MVLVLQPEDGFDHFDGIEVGSIQSADKGISAKCTYYEIVDQLKQLARENGANVIKITERKGPDSWSSCERITAKIYRVPNVRKHEKEIEWTANRRLTWEDFKGSPKTFSNSGVAAQSYCGFGFQTNYVTVFTKTKIFVRTTFACDSSWVRPDQMHQAGLLEHEQGHFDLCEVYARHLRRMLAEKKLIVVNLNSDTDAIFKKISALYLDRQELYEKETDYGRDRQRQMEWTKAIKEELNDLEDFGI